MKKLTLSLFAIALIGLTACNSSPTSSAGDTEDSIQSVQPTDPTSPATPSEGQAAIAPEAQTPGQEAIQVMKKYLPQIEQAANLEELMQVALQMQQDGEALEKKYGTDYKPTPDEEKEIQELTKKFEAAAEKKAAELEKALMGN